MKSYAYRLIYAMYCRVIYFSLTIFFKNHCRNTNVFSKCIWMMWISVYGADYMLLQYSSKKKKKRPTFSLHSLSLSPFWDHSSIIGLYVSLVLVIGRFVRIFFAGGSSQIMYQELPSVDNILNLCLDIYMVRESQDYRMEEYLFSKLIFVYRSPETLIKWTKIKYSW